MPGTARCWAYTSSGRRPQSWWRKLWWPWSWKRPSRSSCLPFTLTPPWRRQCWMVLAAWRTWPLMSEPVISLVNLGRLDYAAALTLQQQVCALRQQESIGDVLLLVEHPPVLTLARNAHRGHVLASDQLLARRGISLFETNPGGDLT